MPSCAVLNCSNSNAKKDSKDIKFYRLPKNPDLAAKWIAACCRLDKLNLKNAVICSKHFESKYFFRTYKHVLLGLDPPTKFRNLLDDAVPTLHLPNRTPTTRRALREAKKKAKNDFNENDLQPHDIVETVLNSDNIDNVIIDVDALRQELANERLRSLSLEKELTELKQQYSHLKMEKNKVEIELQKWKNVVLSNLSKIN